MALADAAATRTRNLSEGRPVARAAVRRKQPLRPLLALVEDYERGARNVIQPAPCQTDTCIGEWHYRRSLFDEHRYRSVTRVVHALVNVVSKNGNLLLSIPVRGDGAIDDDEVRFPEGMAAWIRVNGEAILGTRPWKVADVSLLGGRGRTDWMQDAQGLAVQLPPAAPGELAVALRIKGVV